MKRYIIPAIISAAVLLLFVSANLAHGQERRGTYVASNGKTYRWCPPGQCRMCDDEWAARYNVRLPVTENLRVVSSGFWRQEQQCINGVCSWRSVWVPGVVQSHTVQIQQPPPVITSRTVTTKETAAQAASTPKDIDRMLALLDLTPSDKLADIGCGDGRVVIAAVERYGCKAVGIEIDPKKAAEARRNVLKAVADHRIPDGSVTIVTGDAGVMTPSGVTAAVVYLWPDTLEELRPVLRRIPRVASLMHPIPGLKYVRKDDGVYVYHSQKTPPAVGSPSQGKTHRSAVGGLRITN